MAVGEYASLISLIQDLNQIEQLRARGKIDFDAELLQSLQDTLGSLVSFLEETNSQKLGAEIEALIRQISPAVVEAQFIIGRLVVNQFPGGIPSLGVPSLSHALNELILKFQFIDQGLKILMSEKDVNSEADPDYSDSVAIQDVQFEWEDQLQWTIDKLTGDEKSRQVISIFGMAGVDMTTFARSLYNHRRIQERFDKWMWWCTISEKYNVKEVLQVILGESSSGEAPELALEVHRKLYNRRYFVVMDDVQQIKAWEEINIRLPDCGKGSRILVTTRNQDVANASSGDETNICALGYGRRLYAFKKTHACPNEIEEIGNKDVAELQPVRFKHNITKVVGFENELKEMIDHLMSTRSELNVIPIVGMGGIGKTTLAQLVFNLPVAQRRFDIRLWCTVSKNYDVKVILQDLLNDESNHLSDVRELGIRLHQRLYCRRYLVILDDIWDIDAWNSLRDFFPDNSKGCAILVTTRSLRVSEECRSRDFVCRLDPWDDTKSWVFLREKIFGQDDCPVDLKEIGKKIAEACGGLPLSLVAVAGVLSKSNMTANYWEGILRNIKSSTVSIDGHHGLKVLSTSYYALPMQLKPCFLYFRNFHEDAKIRVSVLLREWIAEGYVQSTPNETIQKIANKYFNDLVERNLVLIVTRNSLGEIKECGVHDLVLDLCIQESAKETFPSIPRFMVPWFKENKTCFMCYYYVQDGEGERICVLQIDGAISSSVTDILVCKQCEKKCPSVEKLILVNFLDKKLPTTLRSVDFKSDFDEVEVLPSTMLYFWNLQFLILNLEPADLEGSNIEFLAAIWDMPQLRYVDIGRVPLPSPPPKANSSFTVLRVLQKLSAFDLVLSDELIERIPNIVSLKLRHSEYSDCSDWCLDRLFQFEKLESLCIDGFYDLAEYKVCFPSSLKKLTLNCVNICWDKTMQIVSSLEGLQVLKLINVSDDKTSEWNTRGIKFEYLETLVIRNTELDIWEVDDDDATFNFPRLKSLVLEGAKNLEIPIHGFSWIYSLNSIHLNGCGKRARKSSRALMEESRDCGGELKLYFDGKLQ